MSNDLSSAELQEKARTEYGIINASEMQEDQLRAEMQAIDSQSEGELEDATPESNEGGVAVEASDRVFTARDSRADLEAEAIRVGAVGDVLDTTAFPNKKSLVEAINAAKK